MIKKLYEIETGQTVKIDHLSATNQLKERFLALGFTKGASVKVIRKGPRENLTVYKIRGTMIALRKEEAIDIAVSMLD